MAPSPIQPKPLGPMPTDRTKPGRRKHPENSRSWSLATFPTAHPLIHNTPFKAKGLIPATCAPRLSRTGQNTALLKGNRFFGLEGLDTKSLSRYPTSVPGTL